MSNDPRIHHHTFVNGRCTVCSLTEPECVPWPHDHVFDVNWNCTICRLSYWSIYGKEPWKPNSDGLWRDKIEDTLDKTRKAVDSANSKLIFILIFTISAWLLIIILGRK